MGREQKSGGAALDTITIVRKSILDLDVECIVNAANEYLQAGSRVCGAIFAAAGRTELQAACDAIGHCTTGEAVITPGFRLKAGFVIHTPGPVWQGGRAREKELLYSCYQSALALAMRLKLDETTDLLQRAELALSPGSRADLIIEYCIRHQLFDIDEVNLLLEEFGQATLGK